MTIELSLQRCCALLILLAASLLLSCANADPSSHSSVEAPPTVSQPAGEVGVNEQVLPGFEPVQRTGDRVLLYEREVRWHNAFLPQSIWSRGSPLANLQLIITDQNGNESVVVPDEFRWVSTTSSQAVVEASGHWRTLAISLRATIEYDGVIDITMVLDADRPVTVSDLRVEARVARRDSTQVLGFKARGIRRQKDRKDLLSLPYRDEFIHAVDVADGNRSFWWFADNHRNWLRTGGKPVTEVTQEADAIVVKQHIVAGVNELSGTTSLRFGLLATPVREILPSRRTRIATSRGPNSRDRKLGMAYKIWWPTAFAYDAYPHTNYVDGRQDELLPSDRDGYPGLEQNLRQVRYGRSKFGLHWLPYFSGHVISMFDPVMAKNRAAWEIQPPKVFRDGLRPYSNTFDKPVLTHNAPGYSDYVVERASRIADELDVEGIYLDHGPPVDSNNPLNGGWQDANGKWQPSLDIFAMRDFLKKLRMAFIEKGRAGYTFVHISNREIMPAYTFAYGIVDGEQYRKRVRDAAYLKVLSLDEFRTRLASGQYGVPNYWLHVEWTNHRGDRTWDNSPEQKMAYRRIMALALLHDLPLWHHREHKQEQERLVELLDRLPFDQARFTGYWNPLSFVASSNDDVKISQYRHGNAVLNIVVNVTDKRQTTSLRFADASADCQVASLDRHLSDPGAATKNLHSPNALTLAPYDFEIVTVRLKADCDG